MVSAEAKKKYNDEIQKYRSAAENLKQHDAYLTREVNGSPEKVEENLLALADTNLNLVSYDLVINTLSITLLGIKDPVIEDARRACLKAIFCLEKLVSDKVDAPFSDYEEKLNKIAGLTDEARYKLIRKLGFTIDCLIDGFGGNTKWQWNLTEIEARFATVAKNLLNLKTFRADHDPRISGYAIRVKHMRLVLALLQKASDGYRRKYELSTDHRLDDMKMAIRYLSAMRRIYYVLGDRNNYDTMKKKIEIWKTRAEADQKTKSGKRG